MRVRAGEARGRWCPRVCSCFRTCGTGTRGQRSAKVLIYARIFNPPRRENAQERERLSNNGERTDHSCIFPTIYFLIISSRCESDKSFITQGLKLLTDFITDKIVFRMLALQFRCKSIYFIQAEIIFFVLIVAILFVFCYHYAFADETQTNEITGNQNTINFGWWGNDERHDYTLQGIDIFEQKNPSINVNCTYSVWSGYERRNRIYMRSGSEPDVMQINYNWISEYSPDGNGYYNLYDLSDYIDLSSYTENELSYGTVNGKLNALPIAYNSVVFFYNQDLLDQYGLDVPKTWDDLFAAAEKLNGIDEKVLYMNIKHVFLTLIAHYEQTTGKEVFDENGNYVGGDDAIRDMLTFYDKMIRAGVINTEQEMDGNDFMAQKTLGSGFWASDADRYCEPLSDAGVTVTLADPPAVSVSGEESSTTGWYVKPATMYAISVDTQYPEDSAKLLDFLVNDPQMALLQGTEKGIPVSRKAQAVLEDNNAMEGYGATAGTYVLDNLDSLSLMIPAMENTDIIDAFSDVSAQYIYGKCTIDEGISTLESDWEDILGGGE